MVQRGTSRKSHCCCALHFGRIRWMHPLNNAHLHGGPTLAGFIQKLWQIQIMPWISSCPDSHSINFKHFTLLVVRKSFLLSASVNSSHQLSTAEVILPVTRFSCVFFHVVQSTNRGIDSTCTPLESWGELDLWYRIRYCEGFDPHIPALSRKQFQIKVRNKFCHQSHDLHICETCSQAHASTKAERRSRKLVI